MRLMSFKLTTDAVRQRSKTVTRRRGWATAKPGDIYGAVVQGQGLKKGQTVERLARIRVVDVRAERLDALLAPGDYGRDEVRLEGFPLMTPADFVAMFCLANGCRPDAVVQRIQFDYLEGGSDEAAATAGPGAGL